MSTKEGENHSLIIQLSGVLAAERLPNLGNPGGVLLLMTGLSGCVIGS
jgi:hypothetical protein